MKNNNIIDDLTKLSTSAASVVFESGKNIQQWIRENVRQILHEMEVVTKDELEIVKKMAEKARLENEQLRNEIDNLKAENQSSAPAQKAASSSKAKAPANKSAKKQDAKSAKAPAKKVDESQNPEG